MEENVIDKLKIEIDVEATEAVQKTTPLTEFTGRKMLNALEDIASTLKRIEQILNADQQHEAIKEAVSHALLGSKYKTTSKDC